MYRKKFDFDTNDYNSLSISQLKQMADHWFRRYLLSCAVRDDRDRIYCQFTDRWLKEEDLHVCHFIDRGVSLILRYSTDNCVLGNKDSNMWESKQMVEGHRSLHHKKFAGILGEKKVEKLLSISKERIIFARQDYIDRIEKWRKSIHS